MRRTILALFALAAVNACSKGNAEPAKAPPVPTTAGSAVTGRDAEVEAADRGRILGAATAPVWMLIISDFQCPYCKTWHDNSFAEIKKHYVDSGKLRLAYVNFPLRIHPNAVPAANAAMCASAQGKFWETQDKIFDTQDKWKDVSNPSAYFDSLAISTGVDAAKQKACSTGGKMKALVDADLERYSRVGVQSTPSFYIGSRILLGAQPTPEFRRVIDSVLAATKK
jgi:protein-disulfide isomerase